MESLEISIYHRVIHRVPGGIIVQVSFSDISFLVGIVNQHLVPGFVFGGSGQRDFVVPFILALKNGINVHNNPPVIEQFMLDKLTYVEFGVL